MTKREPVEDAIDAIRTIYGRWTRDTSVAQMRADWDAYFAPRAASWRREAVSANGVPAEWICAPECKTHDTILYLHGGGFRLGSIDSHRDLMQRLALATSARIFAIDYRLSPEHVFPAALDDALCAYRWLLDLVPAAHIAFAGDSAGAGLAVSTMLAARAADLPLPRASFLMSPWTDLAATGGSYVTHASRDPIHQRSMILGMAKGYLGPGGDAESALASPLYADLAGLPPMLVQCGGRETILDDSRVFATRARAAGVPVDLQIYDTMIHVFQMFGELSEAREALASAAQFLSADRAPKPDVLYKHLARS